jgi:hypothetical protein
MLDVKMAVRRAIEYLQDFQEFVPATSVRLEETEHDDSGDWLITLSMIDDQQYAQGALLEGLAKVFPRRSYRRFRIDGRTGEVKSMKVRTLQPVE